MESVVGLAGDVAQDHSAVVEAVDVPVVAGTVGYNTEHSIELSKQAAKLGVHGILSLCPFFWYLELT